MHINDRIEEVKALLNGIAEDANRMLTMAQVSIPVAESFIKRIAERAEQAKSAFSNIFTPEEKTHGTNG